MTAPKPNTRRDSKQIPAAPPRLASYTRVRSVTTDADRVDEAGAPSTLPPAPFASEVGVAGLEWWLDAHMALVAELAWLEQLLEAGEEDAHAITLRRLSVQAEAVRDALYELYCDAADPRLSPLVVTGAPLERHVRCAYIWCGRVVTLLGGLLNGLRSIEGPDWGLAKTGFRAAQVMYVPASAEVRDVVAALGLDTTNPTEPLRNLPADVEALFTEMEQLQTALATRFG